MKIYGPFIFMEGTVTGMTYLDMLQQWLIPQLDDSNDYVFQQNGAPPQYHNAVRGYLNEHLLFAGLAVLLNQAFFNWPTRSDLTPCDFFLWGYVKDPVHVPPLPELRQRIATAIQTIDADMLSHVWQELDYRLDICRVTGGSHIESL
jgi:hypothetical protein